MNEPEGYISLSEAGKIAGYSAGHIRRLCVSGKIKAQKIGKTWLTTLAAMEEFKSANS